MGEGDVRKNRRGARAEIRGNKEEHGGCWGEKKADIRYKQGEVPQWPPKAAGKIIISEMVVTAIRYDLQ